VVGCTIGSREVPGERKPVIRDDRNYGQVVRMGEMRNTYKIFVRKPDGKRPLGSSVSSVNRCEDNIKMDVKEMGSENVNWI
jgi:hypothetical protein